MSGCLYLKLEVDNVYYQNKLSEPVRPKSLNLGSKISLTICPPVIRQLTGEPEVIPKIDLNGITTQKKTQVTTTSGSKGSTNNNQIRKQSLQDQKKIEATPAPIIQKIDLNGILQPQVHSSSSSSNNSPRLDQVDRKRGSISKPIVVEKDSVKEEGKTLRREPQIIQKIDLNGVLPSMGTQNSTLHHHPERTKRKSLSSQASTESQTSSESNSISNGISHRFAQAIPMVNLKFDKGDFAFGLL
ncbi:hypothetical protein ACTXT7_016852 [Hymenolepis weldensis]